MKYSNNPPNVELLRIVVALRIVSIVKFLNPMHRHFGQAFMVFVYFTQRVPCSSTYIQFFCYCKNIMHIHSRAHWMLEHTLNTNVCTCFGISDYTVPQRTSLRVIVFIFIYIWVFVFCTLYIFRMDATYICGCKKNVYCIKMYNDYATGNWLLHWNSVACNEDEPKPTAEQAFVCTN